MTALKECKLFEALSGSELEALRRGCEERRYEPGAVIFQEGGPGDGIYIVASGLVQISALLDQGRERRVLSRIGPGEFFGEMAVLDNEPRSGTASAETATAVLFLPREYLLHMLDTSPGLAVSLVREFSLRMRDFNRHYIQEVLQSERLTLVGRFARSIVHDFKNPLNIIGLAAEFMEMDMATPEMRKTATARIRKQVDRLTNMINELLEFTRGPQLATVLSNANYGAYVKESVEELAPEAKDKEIELAFKNPPPDVVVAMDQKRLMHVFSNLIHNSVDAIGEGGVISIEFEVRPREVVTRLEDTGPGLAPEILPRLFEAFATYGKAKGTGLGLSICKKIVEDHRGWIKARREDGRGAIFEFGLPLAQKN
jgi:signal transduction histidine kinase